MSRGEDARISRGINWEKCVRESRITVVIRLQCRLQLYCARARPEVRGGRGRGARRARGVLRTRRHYRSRMAHGHQVHGAGGTVGVLVYCYSESGRLRWDAAIRMLDAWASAERAWLAEGTCC